MTLAVSAILSSTTAHDHASFCAIPPPASSTNHFPTKTCFSLGARVARERLTSALRRVRKLFGEAVLSSALPSDRCSDRGQT